MENTVRSDELQHHGIKGMRWGIRRYQNKDGSLTPAGQKRYNKEVEKLKAETEKVKAAEKVAANRKKTQSKLDKLEAEKQKLEERKKALKKGDAPDDSKKTSNEETPEQRRERLLKSTDPKELFEGKDALTTFELNERLQRIDLEGRLQGKIPVEQTKTGMDRMKSWKDNIDTATNLYKSVDNAFDTVSKSAIGKTLAKTLGIEDLIGEKKKPFNLDEFVKNIENESDEKVQKVASRLNNMNTIEKALERNAVSKVKVENTKDLDLDKLRDEFPNMSDAKLKAYENRFKNEHATNTALDTLTGKNAGKKKGGLSEDEVRALIEEAISNLSNDDD